MRILDTFCKAGGAGYGYHLAGHEVVGVDFEPQPRYPFEFHQEDALEYIKEYGHGFDAIHASPPCQAFSRTQKLAGRDHPKLVGPVRELLKASGKPYVIENVVGSPLEDPVLLCGATFGLRTYRHRLFETNWSLAEPPHPTHTAKNAKMGRPVKEGEFMHIVGSFSGVELAREIMGTPWMTRDDMREAIPPAYTEWVGRQLWNS